MLRHKHNFFYKQAASLWTFITKKVIFNFRIADTPIIYTNLSNCVGISADKLSVNFNSQLNCASKFNEKNNKNQL